MTVVTSKFKKPMGSKSDPSTLAALCPSESASSHHEPDLCDGFDRKQSLINGRSNYSSLQNV